MTAMPLALRRTLLLTDIAMLAYWASSGLVALGLVSLPRAFMYRGYGTALIDAWNWSFMPLDLMFAATGLASIRMAARGDVRWRGWASVSLTLTGCAGLMALSFWALTGDFAPSWWIPNLMLLAMPVFWLPRLFEARAT
jgi:hypothetical protein